MRHQSKKKFYMIVVLAEISVMMSGCSKLDRYLDENHQEDGWYYTASINADAGDYHEYPSDGSMLYIKDEYDLYADTIAEDGSIQSSLINTYATKVTGLSYTGEWFFYMIETEEDFGYEIWKRDVAAGDEKKWYVGTDFQESNVYQNYFLCEDERGVWICPIDGNPKTDSITVDELLKQDDKSRTYQTIIYNGLFIQRYRYNESARGEDSVQELKTGRTILGRNDGVIIVDSWRIFMFCDSKGWAYTWLGQRHKIDCFSEEIYHFSGVGQRYSTVEDRKIIGILTAATWANADDRTQDDVIKDVLFWIDIYTGESGIYYDTVDNRTRIIGYQDGTIYLCRDCKVYSRSLESREEQELLSIPERERYQFTWRGDYLVVQAYDTDYWSEKDEDWKWAVKVK